MKETETKGKPWTDYLFGSSASITLTLQCGTVVVKGFGYAAELRAEADHFTNRMVYTLTLSMTEIEVIEKEHKLTPKELMRVIRVRRPDDD